MRSSVYPLRNVTHLALSRHSFISFILRHHFETRAAVCKKRYNMEESSIAEFYKGRSVFITGATGFMGKVLVEKLLRSCPGVDQLYLLMRPSKGKDVSTRLREFIDNQVRLTNTEKKKWL